MTTATTPSDRQQFLETLARGKCSAVSRRFSPDMNLRWMPTIAGEIMTGGDLPFSGFSTRGDAVAAAKKFRDDCRNQIAQANGEA